MLDNDEWWPRCDYCGILLKENDSVWMVGRYVLKDRVILEGNGIEDGKGSSNEDADFCSIKCLCKELRRIENNEN